jgi:hypothetical protein
MTLSIDCNTQENIRPTPTFHFSDYHSAKCHSDECHFAECHGAWILPFNDLASVKAWPSVTVIKLFCCCHNKLTCCPIFTTSYFQVRQLFDLSTIQSPRILDLTENINLKSYIIFVSENEMMVNVLSWGALTFFQILYSLMYFINTLHLQTMMYNVLITNL